MVGGQVIATIEDGDRIYVDCQGTGSERRETCAIYVERNTDSERIRPGDSLWWQGKWAMWTPIKNTVAPCRHRQGARCGVDFDIQIPRRSYSGVNSPMARRGN